MPNIRESGKEEDILYLNEALVMDFTGADPEELSVAEIIQGGSSIMEMVDYNINSRIADIAAMLTGETGLEEQGSVFDKYDEENGYNDLEAETDRFEVYRENLKYMIQYCIRKMRMSYAECLQTDLMDLLDYLKYQIEFDQEEADYREYRETE